MKPKILTTLATYDRQQFTSDVIAGVTVAMVALPLSLAIAIASGVGTEKGVVTAMVMTGLSLQRSWPGSSC
jgi:sulfate permease, SulP family